MLLRSYTSIYSNILFINQNKLSNQIASLLNGEPVFFRLIRFCPDPVAASTVSHVVNFKFLAQHILLHTHKYNTQI